MTVLRISGLAKRFGPTVALDGVDLVLHPGEVHALIGENGAGKSTLMGIVAGALRPDRGAMQLDERPYAPPSPLAARRCGVALIHQELSLCPHLSVSENILLGIEPSRWGWLDAAAARRRALGLLENFAHPGLTPDARLGELPLAAQQVVEICRALAADARILLMDEPTSSLQRGEVDRLFALIRRLAARGLAVVYISHFLEEVREIADRYTVLRDGRSVDAGRLAGTSADHLIAQMVGRPVAGLFPDRVRARSAGGEVLLAVADNLTATRMSACSPGWGWLDLRRQRAVARTWIEALRIRAADPQQPVRALSGGNQQKVAIGRLLYQDADVLLLDEPTRGIDIGSRAQLYETIARCADAGKAVLLVSSYLPELFGLCDRLAVMRRGGLSAARPIGQG